MKKLIVIIFALIGYLPLKAQTNRATAKKPASAKPAAEAPANATLPAMQDVIIKTQGNATLFTANFGNNTHERDVNTIIKSVQQYIETNPAAKTRADVLLTKNYTPLRSFYLTTTNKTTVAASFLYADAPYSYAMHNGALALHIGAVKAGEMYDLGRKTEKGVITTALTTCLFPSLKAFSEFRDTDIRYVGLSVYYGTTDSREEGKPLVPHTLTFIAALEDVIKYSAGDINDKELLAAGELYHADPESVAALNKVYLDLNDKSDDMMPKVPARTVIIGPVPETYILQEVK